MTLNFIQGQFGLFSSWNSDILAFKTNSLKLESFYVNQLKKFRERVRYVHLLQVCMCWTYVDALPVQVELLVFVAKYAIFSVLPC